VSDLFLLFLFLPIILMIWMMAVQRRVRRGAGLGIEPELPAVEPWEEVIKSENGLVYMKRHNPNDGLSDAEALAEDAAKTQILGIGL
jgi:hypothetical protein